MKRLFQLVFAATLTCGATLLTACFGSNDNPVDNVPSTPSTSGIAMIVKSGKKGRGTYLAAGARKARIDRFFTINSRTIYY